MGIYSTQGENGNFRKKKLVHAVLPDYGSAEAEPRRNVNYKVRNG